jgi:hypothetical protein
MHYTPNGSEQLDQSDVGLVFCDRNEVTKNVVAISALNFQFRIPPGATNHRVQATHRFGQDYLLLSLTPHMHFRGKSFRFEAAYPDGSREILLDVPHYDFNWQTVYALSKPKSIPEGTVMHCEASYDNSAENLSNPDPKVAVGWGDQTWEEMMVGFFDCALARQDLTLPIPSVIKRTEKARTVRFRFKPDRAATKVYLAGAFNEWKPTGHAMRGPDAQGYFETTIDLPVGNHEYKYVLDGKTWRSDPANPVQTGIYNNSLLTIP